MTWTLNYLILLLDSVLLNLEYVAFLLIVNRIYLTLLVDLFFPVIMFIPHFFRFKSTYYFIFLLTPY